jgi:hypothetical protein
VGLPVFFPAPRYVTRIDIADAVPLHELCTRAGVTCQGLGAWTARPVVLRRGDALAIEAMPGYASPVAITLPTSLTEEQEVARLALGALAYSTLFDQVARASIRGAEWSRAVPADELPYRL